MSPGSDTGVRRRMSEVAQGQGDSSHQQPEVVAPLISRGLAELAKLPS